jgi:hypothetical protein
MKDFYYILGLQPNCSSDEIKEAYRKLSKKLHPDLNQGDTYFENRFKDINEAFEALSDPIKRRQYDEQLKSAGPRRRTEQAPPSAFTKYRRKGPGPGMIIVLVLLALIMGDYLVRYYNKSKTNDSKKVASVVNPAPVMVYHHHRRKHSSKSKIAGDSARHNFDIANNAAPHPKAVAIPVKAKVIVDSGKPKPTLVSIKSKPAANPVPVIPVNKPETSGNGNFLYATNIKANATGVINMRRHPDFSSDVIGTIPANAKVFVLQRGDDYYRIAFNANIGYVPKWALITK